MVRKKNCPNCGSRKITPKGLSIDRSKGKRWKCNICGVEFSGKSRGRTSKKDKRQW